MIFIFILKIYRYGLHENWNSLTIFVLHLAFCDLLYCAVNLPLYGLNYLSDKWLLGEIWCGISSAIAFTSTYVSLMTIAIIAVNRALFITSKPFLDHLCTNVKSKCIILGLWIIVILFTVLPPFIKVQIR